MYKGNLFKTKKNYWRKKRFTPSQTTNMPSEIGGKTSQIQKKCNSKYTITNTWNTIPKTKYSIPKKHSIKVYLCFGLRFWGLKLWWHKNLKYNKYDEYGLTSSQRNWYNLKGALNWSRTGLCLVPIKLQSNCNSCQSHWEIDPAVVTEDTLEMANIEI